MKAHQTGLAAPEEENEIFEADSPPLGRFHELRDFPQSRQHQDSHQQGLSAMIPQQPEQNLVRGAESATEATSGTPQIIERILNRQIEDRQIDRRLDRSAGNLNAPPRSFSQTPHDQTSQPERFGHESTEPPAAVRHYPQMNRKAQAPGELPALSIAAQPKSAEPTLPIESARVVVQPTVIQPIPQVAAASRTPQTDLRRRRVADPAIHVSIGRIEIRATSAANAEPKSSKRSGPKLSLEDYLKSGGGRSR